LIEVEILQPSLSDGFRMTSFGESGSQVLIGGAWDFLFLWWKEREEFTQRIRRRSTEFTEK
jgi:hypothetical protein